MEDAAKTSSDRALETQDRQVFRIITLGDGDFSFSLDLSRFLTTPGNNDQERPSCFPLVHLTATGFDSRDVLIEKYRYAPFILQQLEKAQTPDLSIAVEHGVNAITGNAEGTRSAPPANCVVFNHPHLGTEDAELHSKFLNHLFAQVAAQWLATNGGVFYLTLAKGQFERWHCLDAARRQGFSMRSRCRFQPPPHTEKYYTFRRSTGKTFDNQVPGVSETFAFARVNHNVDDRLVQPFWFGSRKQREDNIVDDRPFPCPYCSKRFAEERSEKAHVRSIHPDGKKRKERDGDNEQENNLSCPHCPRIFRTEQSLNDHVEAKHTALHKYIPRDRKPGKDDSVEAKESQTVDPKKAAFGECTICGAVYASREEATIHLGAFTPQATTQKDSGSSNGGLFCCSFCDREFHARRAQLQHENRCKQRPRASPTW